MSSIQDFYRDRYANLDQGVGPEAELTFSLRVGAALGAIGNGPKRILDFGCNVGAAAKLFAEAGHDVVGVDISESAIKNALARVPVARFEVIDSEKRTLFANESFDICFCSEVIEHLFAVQEFIGEIHRILVPGGLFLLTTPYHGLVKNLVVVTTNFERHFDPTGGHIRFFSKQSLTRCLEAGGFKVEKMSGLGRAWPVWKSMFVLARKDR